MNRSPRSPDARSRRITALVAGAGAALAALSALTFGAVGAAGAAFSGRPAPTASGPLSSAAASLKNPCYSLSTDDLGTGGVSQKFTDVGFGIYDSTGAADFKGRHCTVSNVDVIGRYANGAGPVSSVNVIVWKDDGGVPGTVAKEFDARAYTDPSGVGDLQVTIPTTRLPRGRTWVTVQAVMSFGTGGEWLWELSYDLKGDPDVWQNPGNGFNLCPTWDTTINCLGVAGDYMVTLGS